VVGVRGGFIFSILFDLKKKTTFEMMDPFY